jgi:hypothetical protein
MFVLAGSGLKAMEISDLKAKYRSEVAETGNYRDVRNMVYNQGRTDNEQVGGEGIDYYGRRVRVEQYANWVGPKFEFWVYNSRNHEDGYGAGPRIDTGYFRKVFDRNLPNDLSGFPLWGNGGFRPLPLKGVASPAPSAASPYVLEDYVVLSNGVDSYSHYVWNPPAGAMMPTIDQLRINGVLKMPVDMGVFDQGHVLLPGEPYPGPGSATLFLTFDDKTSVSGTTAAGYMERCWNGRWSSNSGIIELTLEANEFKGRDISLFIAPTSLTSSAYSESSGLPLFGYPDAPIVGTTW